MPVDPHLLAAFTVTTIVALVTPGPDMLFVLGCGMRGGPRAGVLATLGIVTGDALYIVAAAAGLAVLLTTFPVVFTILRLAGAAYLIYLGIQLIRQRESAHLDDPAAGTMPGRRAFFNGVVSSAANPQTFTFMVALLPQFIDPAAGPVWLQFAVLGAVLIVLEFLADGTVGVLAGRIGGWLRERRAVRRRIDAATGSLFIGLGVRLAADH
ncbi:LysE family translocator [Nocardia goodfellowii]|uniref:Threonine/homoserine/homoserine lactone efflux protein n=1 Tax=Nocardia goodfellowii TaxID=882446 RepID=A0ABS4QNH1_9NOCA|nr:LysE family translocator [Nocardia goodfellowii]MBP2193255.1 threonine/homoserine/homoserine lactone efflux protein [Nocardia goodfellowii]